MGSLTWKFELRDLRVSAVTDYGTYLIQGQPNQTWISTLVPTDERDPQIRVPNFHAARHTCLSDAMRACRYHFEDASEWSGRITVGAGYESRLI